MIKKLGLFIFGLVSLGLINFSSATNYSCSDSSFIISEDSYFIINTALSTSDGYFEISNNSVGFIFNVNKGIFYSSSSSYPANFPIILNSGSYNINCNNLYNSSFSVVPVSQNSSSSCSPSGQCSVSDKINENIIDSGTKSFSSAGYTNMFDYGTYGAGTYCFKFSSSSPQTLTMGFANGGTTAPTNLYTLYNDQYGNWICLYGNKPYFNLKLNSSSNSISYEVYKLTDLLTDDIPCATSSCDYSSYESQIESLSGSLASCQSDNSLLSGNLSTCEGELSSCMVGIGSGDLQWSALYINNIQHLGASVINIDIPEEISWSYTNENDEFDLDVEGYNVDTEYISGIISTQSSLPNQVDLNNLVKVILPLFVPGLVIILFIYFVFRFIKKIF